MMAAMQIRYLSLEFSVLWIDQFQNFDGRLTSNFVSGQDTISQDHGRGFTVPMVAALHINIIYMSSYLSIYHDKTILDVSKLDTIN